MFLLSVDKQVQNLSSKTFLSFYPYNKKEREMKITVTFSVEKERFEELVSVVRKNNLLPYKHQDSTSKIMGVVVNAFLDNYESFNIKLDGDNHD